jgi:hypothetical protein
MHHKEIKLDIEVEEKEEEDLEECWQPIIFFLIALKKYAYT